MEPDISIITPWLDHPQFIEDYERAVTRAGVEVIVIDNGSADPNATRLHEMIGRLGGKYIRNEENRWFAAANNQGLAMAGGKIVLFLNNDIAGGPDWLDAVRAEVTSADSMYGPVILNLPMEGLSIDYLEGWCVAALREVWDRLGGWDEEHHSMPYWEDRDLGFRSAKMGLKLVKTSWPVRHKGRGTSDDVPGVALGIDRLRDVFTARILGQPEPPPAPKAALETVDLNHAASLRLAGHLPESERAYRVALEREPNNAAGWAQYAEVLHLSGRHDAAIDALKRAFSMDHQIIHWINMGAILGRTKRFADAAAVLRQATEIDPQSALAFNNLARALFGQALYQQAADAARHAIVLQPNYIAAYVILCSALRAMNRMDDALAMAHAAVRADPGSPMAYNAVGETLRAMGRHREALDVLRMSPHDGTAFDNRNELAELLTRNPV